MPRDDGLPPGTLVMLVLRVLAAGPRHGYAIAQRIAQLSSDELSVEEGSLYPALQKLLLKGWVKAAPAVSETGRRVREDRDHADRPEAARGGARRVRPRVESHSFRSRERLRTRPWTASASGRAACGVRGLG